MLDMGKGRVDLLGGRRQRFSEKTGLIEIERVRMGEKMRDGWVDVVGQLGEETTAE